MSDSRHKLTNIKQADGVYHVENIEQIQKIIAFATKYKFTVRTLGSGHSPTASIHSAAGANEIKIKLKGQFEKITEFKESKDEASVTVGAGCHLGRDPLDPTSTWENSFNEQIDKKGRALPILGGITHQTIGGFISTGSSGGSTKHSMADVLERIGFVDGTGQYREVYKGDPLFNAVAVSMGLLGVITDVTLKLVPRYFVKGKEVNRRVKDSSLKDAATLDAALFDDPEKEYYHANVFAQPSVNSVSEWMGHQAPVDMASQVPYHHALQSKWVCRLGACLLYITNQLNERGGHNSYIQKILGVGIRPFVDPKDNQEFNDIWYKTLPIDDQAPVEKGGWIDLDFCEMWIPRDQLPEVMRRLNNLFTTNPRAAGNFIYEFYGAKQSPFMMSPSEGRDSVRLDLYWWTRNLVGNANEYFGLFYELLHDIPGLRFHWGKHMPHPGENYGNYTFNPQELRDNYAQLPEFLRWREKMDPSQLFVTKYWRDYFNIPEVKLEAKHQDTVKKLFTPAKALPYEEWSDFPMVVDTPWATLSTGLSRGKNN